MPSASNGTAGAPPVAAEPAATQALPVVDSVNNYEKLHRLGEGTYGVVYKARHATTGQVVALKKVRFDRSREGVPVTSVRELRVLQQCCHPNIVQLIKVVTGTRPDSVFLVFEYAPHDLGRLLDSMPEPFSESDVKCLLKQLCEALAFLHERWIVHRDLKLSNLLLDAHGVLKLCDFGLARYFQPFDAPMTPRVITLWYRAPEVLLGADTYNEAVDCWALGCIMGELLRHEPLFPAESEVECLQMHARLLGTPSPRIWPGMAELPAARRMQWPHQPYNFLRKHFPALSDAGLALLNGLLTYDPQRRLSAREALNHPYFSERPFPKQPHDLPSFPSTHTPAVPAARRGPAGGRAVDKQQALGGRGGEQSRQLQQAGRDGRHVHKDVAEKMHRLAQQRFGAAFDD